MAELSVRKRGSKWEYRFEMAAIDGKRKQKSKGGFRTKAEAVKAGNEALAIYNATGQIKPPESGMSYADFLDLWMEEHVKPTTKENTAAAYNNTIKVHIKPAIGQYRLSSLTHTTLQKIINDKSSQLSRSSLNLLKTVLKCSCKYAMVQKQFISTTPAANLELPRECAESAADIRAYSQKEIESFLKRLEGHTAWYVVMISLHTGMRIGEVYGLTWDDIDFDTQVISVQRNVVRGNRIDTPKRKKSIRKIPFGDTLAQVLHDMRIKQQEDELRLGEYYHYSYVSKSRDLIAAPKKSPCPDGAKRLDFVIRHDYGSFRSLSSVYNDIAKYTPDLRIHNIRHTHATVLAESGVPIKALADRLGHSDVSTTINMYVDNTDLMQAEAVHATEKAWANSGQMRAK